MTYIHLLFDRHEIIWAEGLPCESLHPGEEALSGMDRAARDEVLAIFPELAAANDAGARPLARPEVRPWEVRAFSRFAERRP
ncbi:Hint domain-containing protein [Rhodobacteraceae bacterium NNCM2]|nr:Hint domain-containing protein [Coraliihabitans acroporae]